MIIIKFNNDEVYRANFKRIGRNIVSIIGVKEPNTHGFVTFNEDLKPLGDFSDYKYVYRMLDNGVQYSNDGEVYVPPIKDESPSIPTQEEIKQELIDAVQNHMDAVAQTRGYDGILSACSYIDTGVARFDHEGECARAWRSKVWEYCYAYLDEVLNGEREIPTPEELIKELPELVW